MFTAVRNVLLKIAKTCSGPAASTFPQHTYADIIFSPLLEPFQFKHGSRQKFASVQRYPADWPRQGAAAIDEFVYPTLSSIEVSQ